MLIKSLLYFTIILSGVTFFGVGLNRGYSKGQLTGQDECLTREITRGNVKCSYVVKECKKSCPTDLGNK